MHFFKSTSQLDNFLLVTVSCCQKTQNLLHTLPWGHIQKFLDWVISKI